MLGAIPIWPHCDDIISNRLAPFKSEFPRTLGIVNCTEVKNQDTFIFEIAIANVF